MTYYITALATGLSFIVLILIFLPMEKIFPAKKQKFFRPGWLLDLCFFVGQYFVWGALVIWALDYFGSWLDGIIPSSFRNKVAAQPWWLQVIEVIVLSDFIIYWGHRLQHRV